MCVCLWKGTARRKKKVLHKTTVGDEKKLQTSLKKLGLNPIPSIEEVCTGMLLKVSGHSIKLGALENREFAAT
jgi:hypothetical protein